MKEPRSLAERIATRRTELGLKPADLARVAGVSIAAVLQWEDGSTKNLKNDHLFVIADALNVSPRWLATGQGPKEAAPGRAAYKAALVHRDKATNDDERRAWERIAAGFAKTSVIMLLTIPPFLLQLAPSVALGEQAAYYVKSLLRRWLRCVPPTPSYDAVKIPG